MKTSKRSGLVARLVSFGVWVSTMAAPVVAGAQAVAPMPYLALAVSAGQLGATCPPGGDCSVHRLGGQLRVGAALPSAMQLDLGVARLDALEVGYSALGSTVIRQPVSKPVFVGRPSPVVRTVNDKTDLSATAVTLDALARAPLDADWTAWLRLGVAVVATTAKHEEDGASMGSVTENHFAPHFGLGVDWALSPTVVVSTGVETTRVASDGLRGTARAWHLGVKLGF